MSEPISFIAPATGREMPHRIMGIVETVSRTLVTGWATRGPLTRPVVVRALLDGGEIARSVAGEIRPDLEERLGPNHRVGFRLSLRHALTPETVDAFFVSCGMDAAALTFSRKARAQIAALRSGKLLNVPLSEA